MGKVLTTSASITCLHEGTLEPTTSQSVFTINGEPVLVEAVQGGFLPGSCTQIPPPQSNVPCTTVASQQSGGTSTVLNVNGKPVVLATATGETNGAPGNTWSVDSPGQDVLQAT